MTKAKNKSQGFNIPNKHIHSRANYLYQAAKYLETSRQTQGDVKVSGNSRFLIDQLQSVTLKTQIRMAQSIKHTICKQCQIVLKEGITMASYVENKSKDGRKHWADVLVRDCMACGTKKRFPVGAQRQMRREKRVSANPPVEVEASELSASGKS